MYMYFIRKQHSPLRMLLSYYDSYFKIVIPILLNFVANNKEDKMNSCEADKYYSSLGRMCKNIIIEKRNFSSLLGGQWDSLTLDEQEALFDEHFIPPHIRMKYIDGDSDDLVDITKALKLKSGQGNVEDGEVSNICPWATHISSPLFSKSVHYPSGASDCPHHVIT